jgi:hypothetical protein
MAEYSPVSGQPNDQLFVIGPFFMNLEGALIYKINTSNLAAFGKKQLSFIYMKVLAMGINCGKPFL